jgi:hypothetical protein
MRRSRERCITVILHAHAHAHARFISTTTKPLPDSATNTDYVTLTGPAHFIHLWSFLYMYVCS